MLQEKAPHFLVLKDWLNTSLCCCLLDLSWFFMAVRYIHSSLEMPEHGLLHLSHCAQSKQKKN